MTDSQVFSERPEIAEWVAEGDTNVLCEPQISTGFTLWEIRVVVLQTTVVQEKGASQMGTADQITIQWLATKIAVESLSWSTPITGPIVSPGS